jgi:hypothetical protein
VLSIALVLLALIGLKYISQPVAMAAASGIGMDAPLAVTNMRAGFGAFPLAGALFLLFCLVARDHRRTGLVFVALIMGVTLGVRLAGAATDGTFAESLRLILVEAALCGLSLAAIAAEVAPGSRRSARAPIA